MQLLPVALSSASWQRIGNNLCLWLGWHWQMQFKETLGCHFSKTWRLDNSKKSKPRIFQLWEGVKQKFSSLSHTKKGSKSLKTLMLNFVMLSSVVGYKRVHLHIVSQVDRLTRAPIFLYHRFNLQNKFLPWKVVRKQTWIWACRCN